MATQGIVSLVNEQNQTLVKVICGCDGYNAEKLAGWLKDHPTLDISEIYYKAREFLGCQDCLVVMSATDQYCHIEDELSDLYRQTFNDPNFNPRWKYGTADHVEVVVMAGAPTSRAVDGATRAEK